MHAERRNVKLVQLLTGYKARPNDGSLHDAVLRCKVNTTQWLLKNGHDPKFPSRAHELRNPLELLVTQKSWHHSTATLETMFALLAAHGANISYTSEDKSLLFMALDQENADIVVPALLSAFMDSIINADCNLYRKGNLIFSATSYLEQDQSTTKHSSRTKKMLLRMLRSYSCNNVYYATRGPQPDGYQGAPEELIQEETRRQQRLTRIAEAEEDRQRELNRQEEDHRREVRRQEEIHQMQQRRLQEGHRLPIAQDTERSDNQRRLRAADSLQTERFEEHRRLADIAHQQRLSQQRVETARVENQVQMQLVNAKVNAENRMLEFHRAERREIEAASEREHTRKMSILDRNKQLLRQQEQFVASQKALAQIAHHAHQQQGPRYLEDVD